MKKLLSLLAFSALAFAQGFIGTNISSSDTKLHLDKTVKIPTQTGLNFQAGLLVPNKQRTYLSYSIMNEQSYSSNGTIAAYTYDALLLNYDEYSLLYKNYFLNINYFIGAHLGIAKININSIINSGTYNLNDEIGFVYGLQTGIDVDIAKRLSLELGYKYSWVKASKDISNYEIALKQVGSIFLGFNLLF
jgi:hypothetical protein